MTKKSTASVLQRRLQQAFAETGLTLTSFADQCGIDRSGLSQLLSSKSFRIPRGDTLAQLATALNVSSDWLLGLSEDRATGAQLLAHALNNQATTDEPIEATWLAWHQAAQHEKKRYVPAYGFPSQFETEDVLLHIFEPLIGRKKTLQSQAATTKDTDDLLLRDYETCWANHDLDSFVSGTGFWHGLSAAKRRKQLEVLATALDSLYPDYKLYIFDSHKILPLPLAVFGRQRATIYCNNNYLVFNQAPHIDFLIAYFNKLVRHAVVQPDQAATYIRSQIKNVA